MEVFQRGTPKHSPRGWLGYLGGWMPAMGHMVLMAWGCHDGRWCDVKLGMGSLACHGVVTARASKGSAAGRPGPDPWGVDPLPCLDFSTTFNTFGFGNVRALEGPMEYVNATYGWMDEKSTWIPVWHQMDHVSWSFGLFSKITSWR